MQRVWQSSAFCAVREPLVWLGRHALPSPECVMPQTPERHTVLLSAIAADEVEDAASADLADLCADTMWATFYRYRYRRRRTK